MSGAGDLQRQPPSPLPQSLLFRSRIRPKKGQRAGSSGPFRHLLARLHAPHHIKGAAATGTDVTVSRDQAVGDIRDTGVN